MRHLLWSLLLSMLLYSCQTNTGIAYNNVNVIDIKTGEIVNLNLLIDDGIITQVSETALQRKTTFDLEGKYLIPPFTDMHSHLHGKRADMNTLKKHGVLSVRDVGAKTEAAIDSLVTWRVSNELNIHAAGFIHNGSACEVPQHRSVDSVEDIVAAVAFNKEKNLNYFKIHNCFLKDLFPALDSISQLHDIKIVGHIPQGYDAIEYAKTNVSSIEHTDVILRSLFYREQNPAKSFVEAVQVLDGSYLDSLAVQLVTNNIAVTPTLVAYENYINRLPKEQQKFGGPLFQKIKSYIKRLYDKGVLILPGSDFSLEGLSPGTSLHREFELLVSAGFTNLEVLQIAIVNPATYFQQEIPTIKEGQPANFIILEKNPLEDISNVKEIHGVLQHGKMIDY